MTSREANENFWGGVAIGAVGLAAISFTVTAWWPVIMKFCR